MKLRVNTNIFAICAIFVASFFSYSSVCAQNNDTENKRQVHIDSNGKAYNWSLSNEGCFGCASFYWKIERGDIADSDGLYTYYIVFSTNSFYADKTLTSTYVTDFKVHFVDGNTKYLGVKPFYMLIPPDVKKEKTFKSKNPDQVFIVSWEPVKLLNK